MKGQASTEMLVTLGVVIAFTLPVLILLISITQVGQEHTAVAQAQASARSLADTVNRVYAMGPGARRVLYMNLPATARNVTILETGEKPGGEVVISVSTSRGMFEAVSPTFAEINDLYSTIEGRTGLFPVTVESDANGEVVISVD